MTLDRQIGIIASMSGALDLKDEMHGDVHVLRLGGSLDGVSFVQLETSLDRLIGKKQTRIVVDLGRVQYIASAGVSLLINGLRRASAERGRLVLMDPSPTVRDILSVLGLSGLFPIAEGLDQALAMARET